MKFNAFPALCDMSINLKVSGVSKVALSYLKDSVNSLIPYYNLVWKNGEKVWHPIFTFCQVLSRRKR